MTKTKKVKVLVTEVSEDKPTPKTSTPIVFDIEAYKTCTRLTFEKLGRKNQKLTEQEEELLQSATLKAMRNVGRKALKTESYRTSMQLVELVAGIAVPNEVIDLFSKQAQDKIFS